MINKKIVYVRDEDGIDCHIVNAVKAINGKIKLDVKNTTFLDSKEFTGNKYDVVIFKDTVLERVLEKLPALDQYLMVSVIEILTDAPEKEEFLKKWNYWIDRVPLSAVKQRRGFSRQLKKNLQLIQSFANENLFVKEIVNLIPDGLLLFDLEGNIIQTNSHITRIPDEILKKQKIFDFLSKEDTSAAKLLISHALKENEPINMETVLHHPSGAKIPVEVNARLLIDDNGKPHSFLCILTDISAKKREWETGQLLRHLVNTSPHGIIALDKDNKVTIWNHGAELISGHQAENIMGQKVDEFLNSPENKVKAREMIEVVKAKDALHAPAATFTFPDGRQIKLEANITALKDERGRYQGLTATIRDITLQSKYMEEIRSKSEEMEHLINVVSHELRSPIHSMDNYISFIQEAIRDKVNDENTFEMFERLQANLSNIEAIIRDLTDFSRAGLDSGNNIAVDVNSVIDEITTNIQWQVGRDKLEVKTERLPVLRINPSKIYQVFENLITNAYKFRKDSKPAKAEIRSTIDSNGVFFEVKDLGIGISPQYRDKVFGLFFRAREKDVDGTGAGLAITKKIIQNYGGQIWFETEKDKGTAFKFVLPRKLLVES